MNEMLSETSINATEEPHSSFIFYILADDIWIQKYCLLHNLPPPQKNPH